jgi:hypothetical protein
LFICKLHWGFFVEFVLGLLERLVERRRKSQ